jgi:hypothetical protein
MKRDMQEMKTAMQAASSIMGMQKQQQQGMQLLAMMCRIIMHRRLSKVVGWAAGSMLLLQQHQLGLQRLLLDLVVVVVLLMLPARCCAGSSQQHQRRSKGHWEGPTLVAGARAQCVLLANVYQRAGLYAVPWEAYLMLLLAASSRSFVQKLHKHWLKSP